MEIFHGKNTLKHVKNLSKNIGLLCRSKQLLDNESLKSIYFPYINSYLNYANITWASNNPTKLKKYIISKNKQRE